MESISLITSPSLSLSRNFFSNFNPNKQNRHGNKNFVVSSSSSSSSSSRNTIRTSKFVVDEAFSSVTAAAAAAAATTTNDDSVLSSTSSANGRDLFPKVDKSGRFCSPRAARELALSIAYAACLEGSDPIRLFEKRTNARREPGYEFDKNLLMEYNHMSFGGPPVSVDTNEEADELLSVDQNESMLEAEVLSAPPKLVYSTLILRFARKLLVAVGESWDNHAVIIEKVVPQNWKNKPAGRILELCILHLAMSEITVLGTRHPIVINEAVDLAKRFCDGSAPRIINGCLRTFIKNEERNNATATADDLKGRQKVAS